MTTRRKFLSTTVPVATLALLGARTATAQPARLDEKDPQAVAIGYLHDATKVDAKKHTQWAAGRICANCQLYQAKASDAWGPCGVVGGKLVAAKGWCIAWVKKA